MVLIALLGAAACTSGSTSTTTQPSSVPVAVVDIAGVWKGTFESANLPPQTISLTVVQSGNCVDGAWQSADGNWRGAISGLARADAYVGQMSIERVDGGRCAGVGNVSGPVDGGTLKWTGTGFTVSGTCETSLPTGLTLSLTRQ